jgi:hypothetical protein
MYKVYNNNLFFKYNNMITNFINTKALANLNHLEINWLIKILKWYSLNDNYLVQDIWFNEKSWEVYMTFDNWLEVKNSPWWDLVFYVYNYELEEWREFYNSQQAKDFLMFTKYC